MADGITAAAARLAGARLVRPSGGGGGGGGGDGGMRLPGRRGGRGSGSAARISEITDDGGGADDFGYADLGLGGGGGGGYSDAPLFYDDDVAAEFGVSRRDAGVPTSPRMRGATARRAHGGEDCTDDHDFGTILHVEPHARGVAVWRMAPCDDEQPAPDDARDGGGDGGGGDGDGGSEGEGGGAPRPDHEFRRRAAARAAAGETGEKVRAAARKRDYARLVPEASTAQEEEYQIENDDEGLRWRTTKCPRTAAIEAALGAPQPRTECWGCSHGDANMSAVSSSALARLTKFYTENRFEMDDGPLGLELERYYETQIRGPTLDERFNVNGEVPLPPWRAATIIDHFMNHRKEPQAKCEKRITQLGDVIDHLYEHGVYRAPALADAPRPDEIRVQEKSVRMLLALVTAERQQYAMRPKEMLGYNENFALEGPSRAFVSSKFNTVAQVRKRVVFDPEPPPPPLN